MNEDELLAAYGVKGKGTHVVETGPSFWTHVRAREGDECWLWRGPKTARGYGYIVRNGGRQSARREAYRIANGEVPKGFAVVVRCRRRACMNPAHLVAMPVEEQRLQALSTEAEPDPEQERRARQTAREAHRLIPWPSTPEPPLIHSKSTPYDRRQARKRQLSTVRPGPDDDGDVL